MCSSGGRGVWACALARADRHSLTMLLCSPPRLGIHRLRWAPLFHNPHTLHLTLLTFHFSFTGFASDQCPEGFVAVSKGTLRILTVENVGEAFNQQVRSIFTSDGCAKG